MATQLDIANAALAQTGTRSRLLDLTGVEPEVLYINALYPLLRDFMLAEGDYDFSLVAAAAAASTNLVAPWLFIYGYPADAIRIRQLVPTSYVALDPKPVAWSLTNQGGTKKILTYEAISSIIYTKAVSEAYWDAIFTESFTRLLSSALAFALRNSVPLSAEKLQEALSFAGIANLRDS